MILPSSTSIIDVFYDNFPNLRFFSPHRIFLVQSHNHVYFYFGEPGSPYSYFHDEMISDDFDVSILFKSPYSSTRGFETYSFTIVISSIAGNLIPRNIYKKFPNVEQFSLINVPIKVIPHDFFSSASHLRNLDVRFSESVEITRLDISSLTSLQSLKTNNINILENLLDAGIREISLDLFDFKEDHKSFDFSPIITGSKQCNSVKELQIIYWDVKNPFIADLILTFPNCEILCFDRELFNKDLPYKDMVKQMEHFYLSTINSLVDRGYNGKIDFSFNRLHDTDLKSKHSIFNNIRDSMANVLNIPSNLSIHHRHRQIYP